MQAKNETTHSPLFLVIEANATIRDDLAFSLAARFGARVEGVADIRDAVEWIKKKNEFLSLIIVEDTSELSSLLKYLAKNRMNTPCILSTDMKNRDLEPYAATPLRNFVLRENILNELYALIPTLLTREPLIHTEEYCPIPTHLIERVSPIQGDIFIRLSADKYIRLFAENDFCSQADIEKYAVRKGVPHLYLRKSDAGKFMYAINKHLQSVLDAALAKKLSQAETEAIATQTIDSVQAYVLRFGFDEAVLDVAEKAIQITEQTVSENAKLSNIFKRFFQHNNRYLPVHALVIAHVASAICTELQWHAKGTLYKLIMAAIFHDITITNDSLAAVESLKELEERSGEFTEKEMEEFKSHPFHALQVVEKFRQLPPDVAQIILQHHELPNGQGFPKGLTANNISPLSAVFIVSHELVRSLLTQKDRFSIDSEFLRLVKLFDHGSTFHSILGVMDPYNQKQKQKLYG